MKALLTLFLCFMIIFSTYSSNKHQNRLKTSKKSKQHFDGENNNIGKSANDAYYFNLGSNGGNILIDDRKYKQPAIENNLKDKEDKRLNDFQSEKKTVEVDLAQSNQSNDYYKGERVLKERNFPCRMNILMQSCLKRRHCGWCIATEKCVPGNYKQPFVEKCPKNSYRYA